jgi:OmpA-OmpF porin, OOP family
MKKIIFLQVVFFAILLTIFSLQPCNAQIWKKISQKVKETASNHVVNDAGNATDKSIDKAEHPNVSNGNNNSKNQGNSNNNSGSSGSSSSGNDNAAPTITSYQNYDFVPGDTILFADDFTEDQDGEFPSHWNLNTGQAVVNRANNHPAFFLIEGNYCRVYPLMKTTSYLTDPFTIEFDYYPTGPAYGPVLFLKFKDANGTESEANVQFNEHGGVETGYFPKDFSNDYPDENDATFFNKWHHCAMIYKNNQLKCYVDQNRILVMPNVGIVPYAFGFGGIGDPKNPIIITNIRAASGGQMNMLGKKFTEAKIVTHGITFDVDKSEIKPESMGTLNMIVGVLKNNPELKFEIDGHTDNTGDAAHNLTLSQQRADAVKAQLIKMGIDESRLSTKGFGDTKPISDNSSPEGKANNRRVEFVKI